MFIIYSKPQCTYCDQAKALLEAQDLAFKVINLDVGQQKLEGQTYISREEFLSSFPGQRTLPLILVQSKTDQRRVGGFTELREELGNHQEREAA